MSAVRAIVAHPAELAGVRVDAVGEVAADVERELRTGDGRLPLVAVALAAWWRTRAGAILEAAAYKRLGGVRTIFASQADGVYTELDPPAQAEARAMLLELSSDGRTRRSLKRDALRERARNGEAFDRAAGAFLSAGLLREAGGAIEVVHEFLFTAWDRLDDWLSDARASRRMAAALREGGRTWQELGRPPTRLPSDAEVALARMALAEGAFDGDDADLVKDWVRAAERRATALRWRAVAIAAAVLVVGLVALGAWGKMVSDAQARVVQSRLEADLAAARAKENEERANRALREATEAQAEAELSRKDRQRAADFARLQQAEFERLLHEAETETQKARVRCQLLEQRDRPCPPGDTACVLARARALLPAGARGTSPPPGPETPP
jgi:F0F1-type ATP synthase membrane subunit b/b'